MEKFNGVQIVINKKQQLFCLQLLCHMTLIWAAFNFDVVDWLIAFLIYFITGCLGVSVTLHRFYSHKSFEFKSDLVRKIFTFFSVWGVIGDPMSWVNNHRHHHRLTDKEGDPHSPHVLGFFKVQWFSMFYSYDKLRYVPEMVRDDYIKFIHKHYYSFHMTLVAIMVFVNFKLLAIIYLVPAAILWNAGSFINTIAHLWGNRTYNTKDNSVNNFILGYIVWGEGWHNNHHHSPKNYQFGEKWWQFDAGKHVINLIKK
jgi:fatty-acid desaturase